MDAFCPEFSAYWSGASELGSETRSGASLPAGQGLSPAQEVALEELFELVNAARSVL